MHKVTLKCNRKHHYHAANAHLSCQTRGKKQKIDILIKLPDDKRVLMDWARQPRTLLLSRRTGEKRHLFNWLCLKCGPVESWRVAGVKHVGTREQAQSDNPQDDTWEAGCWRATREVRARLGGYSKTDTDVRSRAITPRRPCPAKCQNTEGGNGVCNTGGTVAG